MMKWFDGACLRICRPPIESVGGEWRGGGKGFHQTPADGSSSSAEADSMKLIQVDVIRVDESDLLDC